MGWARRRGQRRGILGCVLDWWPKKGHLPPGQACAHQTLNHSRALQMPGMPPFFPPTKNNKHCLLEEETHAGKKVAIRLINLSFGCSAQRAETVEILAGPRRLQNFDMKRHVLYLCRRVSSRVPCLRR